MDEEEEQPGNPVCGLVHWQVHYFVLNVSSCLCSLCPQSILTSSSPFSTTLTADPCSCCCWIHLSLQRCVCPSSTHLPLSFTIRLSPALSVFHTRGGKNSTQQLTFSLSVKCSLKIFFTCLCWLLLSAFPIFPNAHPGWYLCRFWTPHFMSLSYSLVLYTLFGWHWNIAMLFL